MKNEEKIERGKKERKRKRTFVFVGGIYKNTTLVFMGYGDRVKSSALRIYLSTHELAGPVTALVHANFA